MKKYKLILFGIFLLIVCPFYVDAGSFSVNITCNNVQVGKNTTCVITGNAITGGASAADIQLSMSGGATIESLTPGNGWNAQENTPSSLLYVSSRDLTGSFTIAIVNIRATSPGTATLKLTSVKIADEAYNEINIGAKQKSFTVNPLPTNPTNQTNPTQKPTNPTNPTSPTQKPTVPPTGGKPTTNTTQPNTNNDPYKTSTTQPNTFDPNQPNTTTQPIFDPNDPHQSPIPGLYLDSVKVGDFPVTYQNRKYYATVNYDTESVEVTATAAANIAIIGEGTRTLAVGKNVVELVIRNEYNQSLTVQVVITRPDDTNIYNTYLASLKVVGYDFNFNKDVKEYTIYVPTTVKELFVIAQSDNVDNSVMGDGLISLTKGDNNIYIKVQYGDKASSEYVIHVKRNYNSLIMLIAIGLLSAGFIGTNAYILITRIKLKKAHNDQKTQAIADANRDAVNRTNQVVVNGQNVITPGNIANSGNIVSPTNRVVPKQVVSTHQPTNPVAVATSAVATNQNPTPAPQQNQVRLVKKVVKPVNTTPPNQANEQIIIKRG